MNPDTDTTLRDHWSRLSQVLNLSEAQRRSLLAALANERRLTAQGRLARRYRNFSLTALICTIAIPAGLCSQLAHEGASGIWHAVAFALYFATASVMDYQLSRGIESIDCLTMDVAEVAWRALHYRKRHFQFMAILIPMALLLVGGMAWLFKAEPPILAGMGAGFVIGIAVGARKLMDFLRDYRSLV